MNPSTRRHAALSFALLTFGLLGAISAPAAAERPAADDPPAFVLETAGGRQQAGTGTYCWAGVCVRKIGVLTEPSPLTTESPISATLRLEAEDAPTSLSGAIYPVTERDTVDSGEGWRAWRPSGEGAALAVDPALEQPLTLELAPGWYLLQLVAIWERAEPERDDVIYGFFLEVVTSANPTPTATVEPTPSTPEEPPAVELVLPDGMVPFRLGSHCWVSFCGDTFAAITQAEPLSLRSPLSGTLRVAGDELPNQLGVRAYRVSWDEQLRGGDDWLAWPWRNVPFRRLDNRLEQPVSLALAPGLHVVELLATWPGEAPRDASYGLLVRVDGPIYLPFAAHGP
jgi:hypothetical protein